MRRKRRRSNGTWFPMLASNRIIAETVYSYSLVRPTIGVVFNGAPLVGVVPVTFDDPQEPPNANADTEGLSELIGNEYIFKRALGSLFVSRSQVLSEEPPNDPIDCDAVWVTAAFFVARAQADNTTPSQSNVPIGWDNQLTQTLFDDYSPQSQAAIREPWMWRRSWILGRGQNHAEVNGEVTTEASIYRSYPTNNVMYPSGPTGTAVDIKSRRHVRQDERLWFAFGGMNLNVVDLQVQQATTQVRFDLDIRIFGSLVKAKARGSF